MMWCCPQGHVIDSQLHKCLHVDCYPRTVGYPWHCTCTSPILLGNGECVRCGRAPEWATLVAVKAYRTLTTPITNESWTAFTQTIVNMGSEIQTTHAERSDARPTTP